MFIINRYRSFFIVLLFAICLQKYKKWRKYASKSNYYILLFSKKGADNLVSSFFLRNFAAAKMTGVFVDSSTVPSSLEGYLLRL